MVQCERLLAPEGVRDELLILLAMLIGTATILFGLVFRITGRSCSEILPTLADVVVLLPLWELIGLCAWLHCHPRLRSTRD